MKTFSIYVVIASISGLIFYFNPFPEPMHGVTSNGIHWRVVEEKHPMGVMNDSQIVQGTTMTRGELRARILKEEAK